MEQKIKQYLESVYDIPFDVCGGSNYGDVWFDIKPHNSERELFDIKVRFKNKIRLTVEVTPEEYSAFSIKDMGSASQEKRQIFAEYAEQLKRRKAKISFTINGVSYDPASPQAWPSEWHNYGLRVSRSPICKENEILDEAEITTSWATLITGMVLSLLNVIKIDDKDYYEGGLKRVEINRYERNPVNRELCLAANGYTCAICGFNFEKTFGSIGHNYIHVHHIVPVSSMTEQYIINPAKDMIPVCPNCHAMLHKQDPPFLPEELKEILYRNSAENNLL